MISINVSIRNSYLKKKSQKKLMKILYELADSDPETTSIMNVMKACLGGMNELN